MKSDKINLISKSKTAVYTIFFLDGVIYASWLTLLPIIQSIFRMNNSTLGMMLFIMSLGSLFSIPFTGYLIGKFGTQKVLFSSFLLLSICYVTFSQISSISIFFVAVFVMGCSVGAVDVSMNVQAFKIEQCNRKSMMSGFHGAFSFGMIIGAFVLGFVFEKIPINFSFWLIPVVTFLLLPLIFRSLRNDNLSRSNIRIWVKPRKKVLLLGLMALGVIIIESSLTDWNTTYMSQVFNKTKSSNTNGIVLYTISVLIGRMFGDRLRTKIKDRLFLWISLGLSTIGIICLITAFNKEFALLGFIISGLGVSVLMPTIFSIAGNHWSTKPAVGISMVASISYFGYLLAPILMGLISDWISIQYAYGVSITILVIMASILYIGKKN